VTVETAGATSSPNSRETAPISEKNQRPTASESLQSVGSRSLFNPKHIDLYEAVIASVCPGLFPPVIEAWQRSLS